VNNPDIPVRSDQGTEKGNVENPDTLVQKDKETEIKFDETNWLESPLHKCMWIKDRLKNDKPIGKALPQSGSAGGGKFWLKQPVLHTKDPDSGMEIMILKYNVYEGNGNPNQDTEKFSNTVQVLLKNTKTTIFPKLFGFCSKLEGFNYIAVEYIDHDMADLAVPTTLSGCVSRARKALKLFGDLDEQLHLTLTDFKPGQWMARATGELVLQDIDDILMPRSKSPYPDQVSWLKNRIKSSKGLNSLYEVDKAFQTKLFPRGELNIRYVTINTELLLDDLGFNWHRDCQMTSEFKVCKKKLITWSQTFEDDWPTPNQLVEALDSCEKNGTFERTTRKPADWRDLKPLPLEDYKPTSVCERSYADRSGRDPVNPKWCDYSCCSAKGGNACYYTVDSKHCPPKSN